MANATPAQKKYYTENKAAAAKKEADKDYEVFGSRGDAARTGMEEGKMNPAGDTYKKGGAVKCKIDGIAIRGKTKAK